LLRGIKPPEGPPGKPVVLFEYRPTRGAKHLPYFLEGFRGYLQTDGYEGYDSALAAFPGIRHIGCFSHARRRFFEAAKVSKKGGSCGRRDRVYPKAL
jgi:transposase